MIVSITYSPNKVFNAIFVLSYTLQLHIALLA